MCQQELEKYKLLHNEDERIIEQLISCKEAADIELNELTQKNIEEITYLQNMLANKNQVIVNKDGLLMLTENEIKQLEAEEKALLNQIKEFNSSILEKDKLVTILQSELSKTNKQVESFIGLQNYLSNGDMAVNYHGWPISSDIALFLVNKMQQL